MKTLIIDIGNSRVKLAVYQDCKQVGDVRIIHRNELNRTIEELIFDEIAIASVVNYDCEYEHKRITNSCDFPFENLYKTPETLGIDRLAGVMACYEKYDKENFLLIDVGTMITVEYFVDGKYIGGNISPGIKSRFNAVNISVPSLPKLSRDVYSFSIGNTTDTAIAAGVIDGIVYEIEGYINHAKEQFPKIKKIFLTGGNAEFIANLLKNTTFVLDKSLVLDGIAYLNRYNS